MSYDLLERRDTPLARKLKERIRRDGPMPVEAYIRACLHDEQFGYYRKKPAIGASGDFITAPEVTQVFGELIGLWCAVVWQQMGSPARIHLIELGPGRGTMMHDALRALGVVPDFLRAARVTLFESNETLRKNQQTTLEDAPVSIRWRRHLSLDDFKDEREPGCPAILLGNEYLDVFGPVQYVRQGSQWQLRGVGLDEADRLAFLTLPAPAEEDAEGGWTIYSTARDRQISRKAAGREWERNFGFADAGDGAIREVWNDWGVVPLLAGYCGQVAGLFIDYGHTRSMQGDTLQAVRGHKYEHPLTSPGEADITAQVDFAQFARCFGSYRDFSIDGPITQAEFLGSLGIAERGAKLMAANPGRAGELETGIARLMAPQGMGGRFKAIGIRSPDLPPLPGFRVVDSANHAP